MRGRKKGLPGHLAGAAEFKRRGEPATKPPKSIRAIEAARVAANIARIEAENEVRSLMQTYTARILALQDHIARSDARAAQHRAELAAARQSHIESLQENVQEFTRRDEQILDLENQILKLREQLSRERTNRRHLVDGRND
jgi:hypothetical protein